MSKTRILIHFVFVTKNRYQTIPLTKRESIYKYIHTIIKGHDCHLIEINGMSDHIHMLINLNVNCKISDLMKDIKQSSSFRFQRTEGFEKFEGWGKGYFAVSVSPTLVDTCQNYIRNQIEHHGGKGLMNELNYLISRAGLEWYEDDWS